MSSGGDDISNDELTHAMVSFFSSHENPWDVTVALFQDFVDRYGSLATVKWRVPLESFGNRVPLNFVAQAMYSAIVNRDVELMRLYFAHFPAHVNCAQHRITLSGVVVRTEMFGLALYKGSTEIALFILSYYLDEIGGGLPDGPCDVDGKRLQTSLMLACSMDNVEVVRAMTTRALPAPHVELQYHLQLGARSEVDSVIGGVEIRPDVTAVMVAAKYSRPEILRRVLEIDRISGANTVNYTHNDWYTRATALWDAFWVHTTSVELAEAKLELLLRYVSVEMLRAHKGAERTMFDWVCYRGTVKMAALFLQRDPTLVSGGHNIECTPFMEACDGSNVFMVQFLLERGADPFAFPAAMTPFSADYNMGEDYIQPAVPILISKLFRYFKDRHTVGAESGGDNENDDVRAAYGYLQNAVIMNMLCAFVKLAAEHQSSAEPLVAKYYNEAESMSINSLCYLAVVVPGDKGGDRLKSCLRLYFPGLIPAWEKTKASSRKWKHVHTMTWDGLDAPDVGDFDGGGGAGNDAAVPQASFCDVCM